jgi:hypothetical protein
MDISNSFKLNQPLPEGVALRYMPTSSVLDREMFDADRGEVDGRICEKMGGSKNGGSIGILKIIQN